MDVVSVAGRRALVVDGVPYVQCACGKPHSPHELRLLATISYPLYLNTDHWRRLRLRVLERDTACGECRATSGLNVHHRSYANRGHERLEDLVILCRACHAKEHGLAG